MSQVDILNFLPHLFWFLMLFIVFYFMMVSYLLPMIFEALQLSSFLYKQIFFDVFSLNKVLFFVQFVFNDNLNYFSSSFLRKIYSYFVKMKNLQNTHYTFNYVQ